MPGNRRMCGLCNQLVAHFRRHANRTHLPWYMCPAFACAGCQFAGDLSDIKNIHSSHPKIEGEDGVQAWFLLVNGFFQFVSRCLGLDSIEALRQYVITENLCPVGMPFLDEEKFFIMEYDRLAGLEPQDASVYTPARVSRLLHYKVLLSILSKLSPVNRDLAKSRTTYVNPDGSMPPSGHPSFKYFIIDGHFHLDELVGRTGQSFKELEAIANPSVNLTHAVANFVYPAKWKDLPTLVAMDSRISFSLGVHPHLLYANNVEHLFSKLTQEFAKYPQAVAVGEVGLDFTTSCRCKTAHNRQECVRGKIQGQHVFLAEALKLADQLSKPVIIHCRDRGDGSAAKGVLKTFVSLGLTHLKVHRHCFVGNSNELDEWSRTLPNCYFSLSRQSTVDSKTQEALLLGDHQRLLLETDSPYLSFPGDNCHGPWRVGCVAQAVSTLLGLPALELIRISNQNLSKLYGLGW